jgi:uncharacterized protein (TIGR03435 family)
MAELDDHQLLGQFARQNSQAAFAALVERHVNLVYSTALRHMGNTHAAEEIAQAVFIILARKAGRISSKAILSGWLYQTTRLTAANFLRGEIRRQKREHEAYMQSKQNQPGSDIWTQIAPLLDEALSRLGERDRNAVVLRFFENKSLREVGASLGAGEDAAKMRVNRALEKLRKIFAQRGVNLSVTDIAGIITTHCVHTAPLGLAKAISTVAAAKGATAATSTLTVVKGALKFMALTKAKLAIGLAVAAVVAAGTAALTVKEVVSIKRHRAYEAIFQHPDGSSMLRLRQAPPVLIVRPTRYPNRSGGIWTETGKAVYVGARMSDLIVWAYGSDPTRVALPDGAPAGYFDYLDTMPNRHDLVLRDEIKRQFGLVAHGEVRPMDVLLLAVRDPAKLASYRTRGRQFVCYGTGHGNVQMRCFTNCPLSFLAGQDVEGYFEKPCLDRTDPKVRYDFAFQWEEPAGLAGEARHSALRPVIEQQINQLGLELVPTNMPIEMLVVEKAK